MRCFGSGRFAFSRGLMVAASSMGGGTTVEGVETDVPRSKTLASLSGWTPKPFGKVGKGLEVGVDVTRPAVIRGA